MNKLQNYLRQNPPRKNGSPGTYSIRLLWVYDRRKKAKKIERGLGTSCRAEAVTRAYILLRALYSLGFRVSNRIRVVFPNGRGSRPLRKIVDEQYKKIEDDFSDLPLFSQLEQLPPSL